jgi:hypothetical protein
MIALRMAMTIVACSLAAAGLKAADEKPNPQASLETAIPEAIRLLKAKEYAEFLRNFLSPDDVKKLSAGGSLDAMAGKFGEQKAPRLLKVLGSLKGADLSVDEDEQIATFKLSEPVEGKNSIRFKKIEGRWYLLN